MQTRPVSDYLISTIAPMSAAIWFQVTVMVIGSLIRPRA
jgi:hypothetical protein